VAVGSVCFVLHSHLPYVLGHGRWPHGADWLNEAAAETYIPLLRELEDLVADGVSPGVTIGLTPILCEQLASEAFAEEFTGYAGRAAEAAEADAREFARQGLSARAAVAEMWNGWYKRVLEDFAGRFGLDLVGAFRRLQDGGHIEIITCAATHGYLPLLGTDESVRAQIRQGVAAYERHFGRRPRGIWLPECAYRPAYHWSPPVEDAQVPAFDRAGLERFLSEAGIEYFIVDSHLLAGGEAVGVYLDRFRVLRELWEQSRRAVPAVRAETGRTPHQAYYVGPVGDDQAPVAFFARDPETALQVWSGEHGYPGDEWYLDFHKKHYPSGMRYWRVTGPKTDMADKAEYDPGRIDERLRAHAGHFADLAAATLAREARGGHTPLLCAPFDAELFGHWWFEGPRWLGMVIRALKAKGVSVDTCGRRLDAQPPETVVALPEGSWGKGGFHWIWLNDWTKWTWRHIYEAEARLAKLARVYPRITDPRLKDAVKQLARELLLLESSDWQFLISTWSARDYAEMRVADHFEAFGRIATIVEAALAGRSVGDADWAYLDSRARRDDVFPDINPLWWAGGPR